MHTNVVSTNSNDSSFHRKLSHKSIVVSTKNEKVTDGVFGKSINMDLSNIGIDFRKSRDSSQAHRSNKKRRTNNGKFKMQTE